MPFTPARLRSCGVARELVPEEILRLGFIGAPDVRPVRHVIEAWRDACFVVQLNGVVEPKLQSVLEAAIQRELQRVVRSPSLIEAARAGHRGVSAIRAHQIGIGRGVRSGARRSAGGQRQIHGVGQECRAQIDRVDVPRLLIVPTVEADVGHVERRRPREQHLRADAELHRGWKLRVVLEHGNTRRADGGESAVGQTLQLSVSDGDDPRPARRVAHERLCIAGARTIEVEAPGSAQDELLLAGHVVRHAEAGPHVQHRERVGGLGDALAGLKQAVRLVPGVGHQRADRQDRIRAEELTRQRVLGLPVRTGARIGVVHATGDIQRRRLRLNPLVGQEVSALQERIVLRLGVHEPHAVVERQLVVHLPVVLHDPRCSV